VLRSRGYGAMAGIFDFIADLFKKVATPPTYIVVKPSNYINDALSSEQKTSLIGQAAVAGQHYVRLWVTRMMLKDSTEWFTKLYPGVYSIAHLRFGDNDVDLANLAGPKQLGDLKPASLDRSLQLDNPMTGLLPFRGGSLQLVCGLAQMPSDNLLGDFLNTLGDFASKVAQPQVSAGIAIASQVAAGIQNFLGVSKAKLNLYYQQNFTGQPGAQALRSGFIFLSDEPSGSISADKLWVINGEPRIGDTQQTAKAITGQNYLLIQIELPTDRDDWDQFSSIEVPLQKATDAKMQGKTDDAKSYLVSAVMAAYDSADLTNADRLRVIQKINDAYNAAPGVAAAPAAGAPPAAAAPAVAKVNLERLMRSAPSVHDVDFKVMPSPSALVSFA
jgi:hypothetical protein